MRRDDAGDDALFNLHHRAVHAASVFVNQRHVGVLGPKQPLDYRAARR